MFVGKSTVPVRTGLLSAPPRRPTTRRRAVGIARDLVGGTFAGRNVAVLGVAFKPEPVLACEGCLVDGAGHEQGATGGHGGTNGC